MRRTKTITALLLIFLLACVKADGKQTRVVEKVHYDETLTFKADGENGAVVSKETLKGSEVLHSGEENDWGYIAVKLKQTGEVVWIMPSDVDVTHIRKTCIRPSNTGKRNDHKKPVSSGAQGDCDE